MLLPILIRTLGVGGWGGRGGGGGGALKVSVLSGLNFRENVRAFFPQGHRKLSITSRYPY